jgi:4,5-DOPA dioxygenase extradiol
VTSSAQRLPSVFIGHGSPINAITANPYTAAWAALGESLPRPKAILAISAHWYTNGTFVTANAKPRTIHDFGGFPQALYEARYEAPGDPALAAQLVADLKPTVVEARDDWGLDHGTWSVLVHTYPAADIPVVQLSIDASQPPAFHYALGQRLARLRDQGVLVFGSGGIVHNLGRLSGPAQSPVPPWAQQFDDRARTLVRAGEHAPLIDYHTLTDGARLAVPTAEHYLPLLYVLATQQPGERATFPCVGFEHGSISMTAVTVGAA